MKNFQRLIRKWLIECFGVDKADDQTERAWRFTEEALELGQSLGMAKSDAMALVDYVYSRDVGQPKQEVGGTMVTLAALCAAPAIGIDMFLEAEIELERINKPDVMQKIRLKQLAKNEAGLATALPGSFTDKLAPPDKPYREVRHHCLVHRAARFGGSGIQKFTPSPGGHFYVFTQDTGDDTYYLKAGPLETHTAARRFINEDSYYEGMSYLIARGDVE